MTHAGPSAPSLGASQTAARSGGDRLVWGVVLLWATLFVIRITAPCDLLDNDQENPAAYVQDVVLNGHWVIQRDLAAGITSKPPLYTWLAAASTLALGRISPLSLAIPTALATLGVALLILLIGRAVWDARIGGWAAVLYLVSNVAAKQMTLVRTDGVFSFLVTLTALAGWRAWTQGKDWRWFWLAAALATLTKGPLGLLLGASGLLAAWWERRQPGTPSLRGPHLTGVLVFLILCAGWFYAAWLDSGQAVIDKMIGRELVGHATGSETGVIPGSLFYKPPLLLLGRFAPWSVLAFLGLWRVWRRPAATANERRFERFLACWLVFGMGVLALGAHQRGDLLFPLIPAAALLAGREVAGWLAWRSREVAMACSVAVPVVGLTLLGVHRHVLRLREPEVRQTLAVQQLARDLLTATGEKCPLSTVDAPYGLQVFLNTRHEPVTPEQAARLMAAEASVWVAVMDTNALNAALPADVRAEVFAQAELPERGTLHILSNRPKSSGTAPRRVAVGLGPLVVSYEGARARHLTAERFEFVATARRGLIRVRNDGDTSRTVQLRLRDSGRPGQVWRHALEPGEVWRVSTPATRTSTDEP